MNQPNRKALPHASPAFVRAGEIYFITICGKPRGVNQFACEPAWSAVVGAARNYHDCGRWYCRLLLAMPDHLHLLVSIPRAQELKKSVTAWKRYLAQYARLAWQRDFFDHRLRSHETFDEKTAYIRANPVRAGMVVRAKDWKFVWSPSDIVAIPMN